MSFTVSKRGRILRLHEGLTLGSVQGGSMKKIGRLKITEAKLTGG